MTWTSERASINQRVQIGAESTPGTAVAAGKLLECFDWTPGIQADVSFYRPTGHKYSTEQEENEEWMETSLSGNGDYNGLTYIIPGIGGVTTPVNHGSSSTAKDWVTTPPIYSSVQPQTYTYQQGDSIRAHSFAYGLFTDFGYKCDRKSFTVSSKMLGQNITDGITLTSSPAAVPLAPIIGKHINVYVDSTSSGLGTTLLTRAFALEYSFGGGYGPFWALNRANASFTGHVDMAPACTMKITLEADSNGMAFLPYLQQGTTIYMRVSCQGNVIDGTNAVNNIFQHDMALKVGKPAAYGDTEGIYTIQWECTIVEDPTWGKSQIFTLTNLLTAL